MNRITVVIMLAPLLLDSAYAAAKPIAVRSIIGLENGESITFTSSPDGGAISILYDNARVQVLAADPPVSGGIKELSHRFRLALGRPKELLIFDLRGFRNGVRSDLTALKITVGGKSVDLTPALDEESYDVCAGFDVAGRTVDVIWVASAAQKSGDDATLIVDSIDVSAIKPGGRARALRKCILDTARRID